MKLIFKSLILIFTITVSISCEEENLPPTCEITIPENGARFYKEDMIDILVNAWDRNGGSISEIIYFIDDIEVGSVDDFPYIFHWDNIDRVDGMHKIIVTAIDDMGAVSEDEISILFNLGAPEESGTFTDSRDDHVYKTIKIGDQWWMAENLAYLPSVSPFTTGSSLGSNPEPYYYVYNYHGNSVNGAKATSNYTTYGVLYNGWAALNACPPGWHLPRFTEWTMLLNNVGGTNDAGVKLKEAGITHWHSPNTGATNESGFSALPGGLRAGNGFFNLGLNGYWWGATESTTGSIPEIQLYNSSSNVLRWESSAAFGNSVRCLQD